MKTLIGGAVGTVLGVTSLACWWSELLNLVAGSIPVVLLAGGALAIYLGFDEVKDTWKNNSEADADS